MYDEPHLYKTLKALRWTEDLIRMNEDGDNIARQIVQKQMNQTWARGIDSADVDVGTWKDDDQCRVCCWGNDLSEHELS